MFRWSDLFFFLLKQIISLNLIADYNDLMLISSDFINLGHCLVHNLTIFGKVLFFSQKSKENKFPS